MRITGGRARGIPLKVTRGAPTRPATDRMREAVFASLGEVDGQRFIDLFAGSGAYGLEAWSRGAAGGYFVERNRRLLAALRGNISAVARSLDRSEREVQAIAADVERWQAPEEGGNFGLVFADPPYGGLEETAPVIFERALEWLSPDGRLVFEMPGGSDLEPERWTLLRRIGRGRHEPTCGIYCRA